MSAHHPVIFLRKAATSLFQFPPNPEPQSVPPPAATFNAPFAIPDSWYTAALDPKVPITIASVYAVSAKLLNVYNKSTNKKPWAISQTRAFRAFVVFHNVFLAVYSAWTWWGMLHTLRGSLVSPSGPNGWAGTVDSLCKLHGPEGLGNALSYGQSAATWQTSTGSSFVGVEGFPNRQDGGRMWNEGLAFYGWIFYLSKFYEVIDTFVILAKGKLSSTLQSYHHAGAMMAMWAGIRYMSAPIWMFVFFNSFVHSLMYTYYTVTSFNIKVPNAIKRCLTTLQISQFIIGSVYAALHLFVSYTVPVQVAADGSKPSPSPQAGATSREAGGYETRYQKTDCISTEGATFAIWLNVVYLLPLTYLFVSFFIESYTRRTSRTRRTGAQSTQSENQIAMAEKAGWDAAKKIESEIYAEGSNQNGKANGKH